MERTGAGAAALEVATRFYPVSILNHCLRSYHFAVELAARTDLDYDDELLFVAAAMHDLGLVGVFDSASAPFEYAGAALTWVLAAGAGWPIERRERVGQVVVAHMADSVDPAVDLEGHLLERATSLDISGRGARDWPPDVTARIVHAYPRHDLAEAFASCFEVQASRKPNSAAARAVEGGVRARLATNALEDVG